MMTWAFKTTCCVALFSLGCTQGTPSISATENLAPIILDQNYFESKSLELYDIPLTGRVSKFVSSLEVSFDNGTTWSKLENTAQSVLKIDLASCSVNCPFTYSVENIGQVWPILLQLPFEAEAQGLLRGRSVYGMTEPTIFRIKKMKRGFTAVGSIGLNRVGSQQRALSGGFKVLGGKLESRKINSLSAASGVLGYELKAQGVVQ